MQLQGHAEVIDHIRSHQINPNLQRVPKIINRVKVKCIGRT